MKNLLEKANIIELDTIEYNNINGGTNTDDSPSAAYYAGSAAYYSYGFNPVTGPVFWMYQLGRQIL